MSETPKGTRIDLGDDLLVTKTNIAGANPASSSAPNDSAHAVESVEELILNAKILMSEGLIEDAKKTLRKVLRLEPGSLTARDRLEDIQKVEIKRLLGADGKAASGFVRGKKAKVDFESEDGELVAAALERELGSTPSPEENFFGSEKERVLFQANLDALCVGASAQDRVDLGIGFLEMELYDVAIQMFQSALAFDTHERRARVLLATAWIAKGSGFEAMIEIETLIADQSVPEVERVEYGYLAGRAQELLERFEMAARWYRAILQIDPSYRDGADRLARCLKMANRSLTQDR